MVAVAGRGENTVSELECEFGWPCRPVWGAGADRVLVFVRRSVFVYRGLKKVLRGRACYFRTPHSDPFYGLRHRCHCAGGAV